MIITPISTLDAVNEILSSVGEAPVNTLEDNYNVDVMNALRILKMVNNEVQSKGWTFNTIQGFRLDTDALTNKIQWDSKILFIRPDDTRIITNRGGYAYDITNKTDEFKDPIVGTVYYEFDFDELPAAFRRYITAKSCRMFTARYLGDQQLSQHMGIEEQQAYAAVMEYELDVERPNMGSNQNVRRLIER